MSELVKKHRPKERGATVSVRPYVIGFITAIFLTLAAYIVITSHSFNRTMAAAAIIGLAVVQLVVQLFFFLHLGREEKPRWNLAIFLFMLMILVLIVGGSLWIMYSLNYNMMNSSQMNKYMMEQSNEGF